MNDIVLHGEFFAPVPVDPSIWGSIILDLILRTDSEEGIASAYELDLPGLEALKNHPPFKEEFDKAVAYVKSLGPDGGFKLRARAIAEEHIVSMAKIINDGEVHPSVRAALWRDMVKYADLDPAIVNKNKEDDGAKKGVTVNVNMHGLFKGSVSDIIDVKPE